MENSLKQVSIWFHGKHRQIILLFVILYSVGAVGFIIPQTSSIFAKLTPVILIMSFLAILVYHESKLSWAHLGVIFAIFLVSYVAEAIGVNTGLIFGTYQYGESLGLKVFETPLLIGMNWVFLVYSSSSLMDLTRIRGSLLIFSASLVMVSYDLILEQVAGDMGMWYWADGIIPLKNYLTWFVLAILFHWAIKRFAVPTRNKVAPAILLIQSLFFLMIFLLKGFVS